MSVQISFRALRQWPKQITRNRRKSLFDSKHGDTIALLERELRHLQARNIVVEADCPEPEIRRDGMLRSNATLNGPGIVVRFDSPKGSLTFPCDTFMHWKDNLRAIAKALEALRMVDRYGVTSSGEQYRGWTALPDKSRSENFDSQEAAFNWVKSVVGTVKPFPWNEDETAKIRKAAISFCHPDRNAGDDMNWRLWQQAAKLLGIEI